MTHATPGAISLQSNTQRVYSWNAMCKYSRRPTIQWPRRKSSVRFWKMTLPIQDIKLPTVQKNTQRGIESLAEVVHTESQGSEELSIFCHEQGVRNMGSMVIGTYRMILVCFFHGSAHSKNVDIDARNKVPVRLSLGNRKKKTSM